MIMVQVCTLSIFILAYSGESADSLADSKIIAFKKVQAIPHSCAVGSSVVQVLHYRGTLLNGTEFEPQHWILAGFVSSFKQAAGSTAPTSVAHRQLSNQPL